ncbi:MAG: hypothetical protein LBE13_15620 [Bacteroidales bacterium]|nr:hypothetical protein [Bacteroidales bacterium]
MFARIYNEYYPVLLISMLVNWKFLVSGLSAMDSQNILFLVLNYMIVLPATLINVLCYNLLVLKFRNFFRILWSLVIILTIYYFAASLIIRIHSTWNIITWHTGIMGLDVVFRCIIAIPIYVILVYFQDYRNNIKKRKWNRI